METGDPEEVGRSNVPANSTEACDDVGDSDVPLSNTYASGSCQDQTSQTMPTQTKVDKEVAEYQGSDAGPSDVAKTNEGPNKADFTSDTVLLTCNIPQISESTQTGSCGQLNSQSQSAQLQTESASTKKHRDTRDTSLHVDSDGDGDGDGGASEDESVFYIPSFVHAEEMQSELEPGSADAWPVSLSTRTPTHGASMHSVSSVGSAEHMTVARTTAGGSLFRNHNAVGDEDVDEMAQIDALIVHIYEQLEFRVIEFPNNRPLAEDSDEEPPDSAENERRRRHAGLERWLREKGLRTAECAICCDACICVFQACCRLPVCIFCLRRYFHTRIDNGALQIACPNSLCRQFVDRSEVTYFVNPAHKQRFYALLADANQFPNTRTCPACSCLYTLTAEQAALLHAANGSGEHGAVVVDGSVPRPSDSASKARRRAAVLEVRRNGLRVDCNACGTVWCFACHAAYHFSTTCSEFRRGDKLVSDWARQRNAQTGRNAQRCPRCHVLIEKTSGCNHMTCQRCSAEFCYLCGRRYQRVKLLGGHDSRFSVFGCKYSLLPDNAPARNAIRGSLFVGKIMMCTLIGTLAAGLVVALLPVGVVAAPAVGIYVAVRKQRKKRNSRRIEREVREWRSRSIPLPTVRSITEPTALSDSGTAPERESDLPTLFLFDDLDGSSFTLSSALPRINMNNFNDDAARPSLASTQPLRPSLNSVPSTARDRAVDNDLSLRADHDRQRPESSITASRAQPTVSVARDLERIDEDATMRGRRPIPIDVEVVPDHSAPGWFVPRPPTPPPVRPVEIELPARPPRAMSVARGIVHRVRSVLRL